MSSNSEMNPTAVKFRTISITSFVLITKKTTATHASFNQCITEEERISKNQMKAAMSIFMWRNMAMNVRS